MQWGGESVGPEGQDDNRTVCLNCTVINLIVRNNIVLV